MPEFNFIVLYVDSPLASAGFYTALLGRRPVESSPTFAMFALDSGVMLGLWSRHAVEPSVRTGGGGELAFTVSDPEAVRRAHDDWSRRGIVIAQSPTEMDFGHSFVALDPDGHRLRIFAPARR
jgi:catechol 2,3-dioxygenase-like lactoylglutathione lyase family enzyme